MLTLRPSQMAAFEQYQEGQFRATLRRQIQQDYPAYAPVPPAVLDRLLGFGLARARHYGFAWQSSLAEFVYLMAAVAPNFDSHPAIHAYLVNAALPLESRIAVLAEHLPDGVWDEAIANASQIGWFLTEDGFAAGRLARLAAALPRAVPAADWSALDDALKKATSAAAATGWTTEDAQFVFAAAWQVYGEDFQARPSAHPWSKAVFDPGSAVKTQVALLRIRLALDHQLWL